MSQGLSHKYDYLDFGGIIRPGSLAWRTFPELAPSLQIVAGGSQYADGNPVAVPGTAALAIPYWVTHLSTRSQRAASWREAMFRVKLRPAGGSVKRTLINRNMYWADDNNLNQRQHPDNLSVRPLKQPALTATEVIVASSAAGLTLDAYCTCLVRPPEGAPELLKTWDEQGVVSRHPLNNTAGGSPVTGNGAWVWGAYSELLSSLPIDILITKLFFQSWSSYYSQLALATGPAGSEIPFGIWGNPGAYVNVSYAEPFDLMPFPFLLPAGTRLSVRAAADTGNVTFTNCVGFEYVELPVRD